MKNSIIILISALLGVSSLSAQVGIGTTSPNSSAALDVFSSNKGILLQDSIFQVEMMQRQLLFPPMD